MRRDSKLWLVGLFLCIAPMAASADDADSAKLISECSATDLPRASLDSCLERVRVREETDPSPGLQALEASLEQRESGRPLPMQATASTPDAPRVVEVAPAQIMPAEDGNEQDEAAPRPAEPANSPPPQSGAAAEDEPPVADPPDTPTDEDRATDDDAGGPPQL